jgi:hypothetical protein
MSSAMDQFIDLVARLVAKHHLQQHDQKPHSSSASARPQSNQPKSHQLDPRPTAPKRRKRNAQ